MYKKCFLSGGEMFSKFYFFSVFICQTWLNTI